MSSTGSRSPWWPWVGCSAGRRLLCLLHCQHQRSSKCTCRTKSSLGCKLKSTHSVLPPPGAFVFPRGILAGSHNFTLGLNCLLGSLGRSFVLFLADTGLLIPSGLVLIQVFAQACTWNIEHSLISPVSAEGNNANLFIPPFTKGRRAMKFGYTLGKDLERYILWSCF